MRINGGGNVGIGINNPQGTLEVIRGTGLNGTAAFYGTTWTFHFNYSTEETTSIRGGKNNSKVLINDLALLGDVGIGTPTPSAKLHIQSSNSYGMIVTQNSGLGAFTAPTTMLVANSGSGPAIITIGGVQIGSSTTPAGYKMSVDGKVICTELEVLVTPWPDYVFKPNYKLKPLHEIENFIAKNGHLPNIPKAEGIENKSLALGNLAKLQMEKIEELTLYLIEIKKKIRES